MDSTDKTYKEIIETMGRIEDEHQKFFKSMMEMFEIINMNLNKIKK